MVVGRLSHTTLGVPNTMAVRLRRLLGVAPTCKLDISRANGLGLGLVKGQVRKPNN